MSRSNLPVPIGKTFEARRERIRPREARTAGAYAAHLYGQDGRKRGLKAGQPTIDEARAAYLGAEYSGEADRRPPPGLITIKKI